MYQIKPFLLTDTNWFQAGFIRIAYACYVILIVVPDTN